jgi:hypothetical protein
MSVGAVLGFPVVVSEFCDQRARDQTSEANRALKLLVGPLEMAPEQGFPDQQGDKIRFCLAQNLHR